MGSEPLGREWTGSSRGGVVWKHRCLLARLPLHLLEQSVAEDQGRALLKQRVLEKDPSCPKGGKALVLSFNFGQKWN